MSNHQSSHNMIITLLSYMIGKERQRMESLSYYRNNSSFICLYLVVLPA